MSKPSIYGLLISIFGFYHSTCTVYIVVYSYIILVYGRLDIKSSLTPSVFLSTSHSTCINYVYDILKTKIRLEQIS